MHLQTDVITKGAFGNFLRQENKHHVVSHSSGLIMGIGKAPGRGNHAMGRCPIQEGVAILLVALCNSNQGPI